MAIPFMASATLSVYFSVPTIFCFYEAASIFILSVFIAISIINNPIWSFNLRFMFIVARSKS